MSDDLSGDMLAQSWPNLVFCCICVEIHHCLFTLSYRGIYIGDIHSSASIRLIGYKAAGKIILYYALNSISIDIKNKLEMSSI